MHKRNSFNNALSRRYVSLPQIALEAVTWCIAILCTIIDICWRCIFFILTQTARLLLQIACALLLASLFLLAYAVIMGISMAFGPGINSQLS